MAIRFCTLSFPQLIDVRNDESFAGFLAPIYYGITDPVKKAFGNITKFTTSSLGDLSGDPDSLHGLDGCMGKLQRNESDFALPFMEYPITVQGIKQSTFMFSKKMAIVSAYNNTPGFGETDVMDAFHSFKKSLWTLTSATALVLTIMALMGTMVSLSSLKQLRRYFRKESISLSVKVAIGNILKQHSAYNYPCKHHYQRIIIGCFAVFSFLMIFFFSSMIKTEMVVRKDPRTITSYDEVIANGVQPLFVEIANEHANFKYANPKSREGRIWLLANKYGLQSCMISSVDNITHVLPYVLRQSAVWMVSEYIGDLFLKNLCPFIRAQGYYNDLNSLIKSDPTAPEKVVGIAYSSSMNLHRNKRFLKVTTAFMEKGLVKAVIKSMEFSVSPDTGSKALRDCLANKIVSSDSEFHTVLLAYYSQLFLISACLIMLILLVLIAEIAIHRISREYFPITKGFTIPEVLAVSATHLHSLILASETIREQQAGTEDYGSTPPITEIPNRDSRSIATACRLLSRARSIALTR